jgi:signal transduction histidine kinase
LSEILLYAKPQVLQLFALDVNEFIGELLLSIREMPETVERKIEFIPASSPIAILADKDKLKQVFINIVRNACEAVAPGDVIKWTVDFAQTDKVCINVQNSGEPIPSEVIAKLATPFFSTKTGGTGLGLAITKRIVNAHNGELLIFSELLTGTTVTVRLPVVAPPD